MTRQAARSAAWGHTYPAPEFQKNAQGELVIGLPLVKALFTTYLGQERKIRKAPSAEEIEMQRQLMATFEKSLKAIGATLKNVLEVLALPVVCELPAVPAIKKALEDQVSEIENMESLEGFLN